MSDVDALLAEANALADQMIECNPTALRTIKRVVKWGADMPAEHAEKLFQIVDEATRRAQTDTGWQRPGR